MYLASGYLVGCWMMLFLKVRASESCPQLLFFIFAVSEGSSRSRQMLSGSRCRLGVRTQWLLSWHPQTDIITVCRASSSVGLWHCGVAISCLLAAAGPQAGTRSRDKLYDTCKGSSLKQDKKTTQGLPGVYLLSPPLHTSSGRWAKPHAGIFKLVKGRQVW